MECIAASPDPGLAVILRRRRIVTSASRDRVTIDLRGLRPAVEALAAARHMTLAALGRMALVTVLDRLPGASAAADQGIVLPDQKIKFTVRLHRGDVAQVVGCRLPAKPSP